VRPLIGTIGQPRTIDAIDFGLAVASRLNLHGLVDARLAD
jgi:hypothetical protein